jgi:hypothetical protein
VSEGETDPVLYVRTACADPMSEIACDDDTVTTRNSRIDIDLDAGDYFLMLDSFRDSDEGPMGRCGRMELRVDIR